MELDELEGRSDEGVWFAAYVEEGDVVGVD